MTTPLSSSITNQGNFLRTSRNFPSNIPSLTVELNRTYVDIAAQVNNRTLGIFGTSITITGEQWFLQGAGQVQATLREVIPITGSGNYAHGITFSQIAGFTRIYGTGYDGTTWYPLPYVDTTSASNQISVKVDGTNVVVQVGGGAPVITSGFVVLEFLSKV